MDCNLERDREREKGREKGFRDKDVSLIGERERETDVTQKGK